MSQSNLQQGTDPQLLKAIPGPNLFSVFCFFLGKEARDKLEGILSEYDLFMKKTVDIGRCKIAKNLIDLKPDAVSHRKVARRLFPDRAAKANKQEQNLLALGLIQPSYSPWASGSLGEEENRRTSLLL